MRSSQMLKDLMEVPLEAQMLTELEALPYWARITHEMMLALNPKMMTELSNSGKLREYLMNQHDNLAIAARQYEKDWLVQNRLSQSVTYFEQVALVNQAKMAAREALTQDLARSAALLVS